MEYPVKETSRWSPARPPQDLLSDTLKAVMIFGPDTGGVCELAGAVCRHGGAEIQRSPAQGAPSADLAATLGATTLFGGAGWVRLDGARDRKSVV